MGSSPPCRQANPAPPYIFNRPTDVAFDAAGQHLRRRRLRAIHASSSTTRTAASSNDVGSRGSGPGQIQPDARHRRGCQGKCLRGQPQRPAHSGVRQRPELQDDVRPRRRALVLVHHPRSASILYTSNSNPDSKTPRSTRSPARSSRWSWTAPSSASSVIPGKEQGQFSTVHGIDCRVENEISRQRNRRVARPEIHPAPHRREGGKK